MIPPPLLLRPTEPLCMMDPPLFFEFMNTNDLPPDDKIPAIEALLIQERHEMDRIDEEIAEVERALNALREHQRVRLKALREHEAILAPIKRLPIDILSSIFLSCSPVADDFPTMTNMRPNHPSVIISHVCRLWRQVSFNTPLLWADIELCIPPYPSFLPFDRFTEESKLYIVTKRISEWEAAIVKYKAVLKTWIARSSGSPLSLNIKAEAIKTLPFDVPLSPMDARKHVEDCIDILCGVSNRWKHVNFELSANNRDNTLLRLLLVSGEDVSLLETLKFMVFFHPGPIPAGGPPSLLAGRQQLPVRSSLFRTKSLRSLGSSLLWVPLMSLPVDWASLTELSFGGYEEDNTVEPFRYKDIVTLLGACSRLVHCKFVVLEQFANGNTTPSSIIVTKRITLPFLQSMSLRGSLVPHGFGSSLALPSIHTFQMLGYLDGVMPRNEDAGGIVDCIRSFGSTLTTIAFNYSSLTQSALQYCLEHLPNAVHLKLGAQIPSYYGQLPSDGRQALFSTKLLEKLTPKFSESGQTPIGDFLCPRLEKFECQQCDSGSFTGEDLVRFIAARRKSAGRIGAGHPAADDGAAPAVACIKSVGVNFASMEIMGVKGELEARKINTEHFDLNVVYLRPYETGLNLSSFVHQFDVGEDSYMYLGL